MAFIRSYSAQGDPIRLMQMRAGLLFPRRGPGRPTIRSRLAVRPGVRALLPPELTAWQPMTSDRIAPELLAGDPFLGKFFKRAFKPPKFIRKLQPGKLLTQAVKAVAPVAASFIPGVGGLVSGLMAPSAGPGPETLIEQPTAPEPASAPEGSAWSDGDLLLLLQLLLGRR